MGAQENECEELRTYLFLDSGTLTPALKKLEQKGYITRERDKEDERVLNVVITQQGEALKEKALDISMKIGACIPSESEDAKKLYEIMNKLLKCF